MTKLSDYMDLKAEVLRLIKVPSVSDNIKAYTLAAEQYISRDLRHRKQITKTSVTFTNGVAPLPADYMEMLNIFSPSGWTYSQAPLSAVLPASSGTSTYAVDDANVYIPGAQGPQEIYYYAYIPTITGSPTDTNWCLQYYPELYTYSVLACASAGNVPPDAVAMVTQMREMYLAKARIDSERAQYGNSRVRAGGHII